MDRSERIKLAVASYWIIRQQFDNLMLSVLVFVFIYIRIKRRRMRDQMISTNSRKRDALGNMIGGEDQISSEVEDEDQISSEEEDEDYEVLDHLVDTVKAAIESHGKNVQTLVNAISGIHEERNLSKALTGIGFSSEEIVQIAIKFSQNPELMRTFWSLGDERKGFVDAVMKN